MRHIMTFQSRKDLIYDGGPIILYYRVIKKSLFNWGAMKNSVYSNNHHTIDDLKMSIAEYIRNADRTILN
jgi:hypothetical protein